MNIIEKMISVSDGNGNHVFCYGCELRHETGNPKIDCNNSSNGECHGYCKIPNKQLKLKRF